jgi:hypothetical protein
MGSRRVESGGLESVDVGWEGCSLVYIGTLQKECSTLFGNDSTLNRSLSDIEDSSLACEI